MQKKQRALPAIAFLLGTPCLAQGVLQPQAIPSPVRNAGIYHVATGTWTRGSSAMAALGPDVIYRNDAFSGYFTTLGSQFASGDHSILDSGRIPTSAGSVAGVTQDVYVVDGLEFSYCSDDSGPNLGITFSLYDSYRPCDLIVTAPTAPFSLAGSLTAIGLPGSSGGGSGLLARHA